MRSEMRNEKLRRIKREAKQSAADGEVHAFGGVKGSDVGRQENIP